MNERENIAWRRVQVHVLRSWLTALWINTFWIAFIPPRQAWVYWGTPLLLTGLYGIIWLVLGWLYRRRR